jgi:hypothetical protein
MVGIVVDKCLSICHPLMAGRIEMLRLSNEARKASWRDLLRDSLEPPSPLETTRRWSPVCASYLREERLQFRFLAAFQALVLLLAVGGLILLLVAIWRAISGEVVETLIVTGGAVLTGAASKYLDRQRKDAREAFAAAQDGMRKNCGL